MGDNVTVDNGGLSDFVVSSDEATSGQVQRFKLAYSADGSDTHVTADSGGLLVNLGANNDVTLTSGTVTIGGGTANIGGTASVTIVGGTATIGAGTSRIGYVGISCRWHGHRHHEVPDGWHGRQRRHARQRREPGRLHRPSRPHCRRDERDGGIRQR